MATFKVKTKNEVDIDKKPRVYFTCHPDDLNKYLKKVCDDIFKTHDCAIYYTQDMNEVIAEDEKDVDLGRNNLFVIPVTLKLLTTPNRAIDMDIPYATNEHIPILPIMMEDGIDEFYSKPDKFGDLQYLNPYSNDPTEISYEEKLKKYLESVLISEDLANRIRTAFDAYIFLSYRKKDRKYANKLMHLIHSVPECRNIAIWFDEFLTPGESFKENIERLLDDCRLFTLLVTPRLLEKVIDKNGEERDNYVISTELPLARRKKEEKGTDIFAVEMENTDKEILSSININDYVNFSDKEFRTELLDIITRIIVSPNHTPEHDFLVGLAYLEGIDMEVNRERATELITSAANMDLPEAMSKLISMYIDGVGVQRNQDEAKKWSQKLADYYFKRSFSKKGTIKSKKKISELFANYKNPYWTDTIKSFLTIADTKLSFEIIKNLFDLLLSFGICEYTLLFDACKEMVHYQKETQCILVTDILIKSVDGIYPPYGPLFWYIPEYNLYEISLLVLNELKGNHSFAKMLALVRDVCFILGRKYTVDKVTHKVNGAELYNAAKPSLIGVRNALCELFYTHTKQTYKVSDIYPRCFNLVESVSFMKYGYGETIGNANFPFIDELGLYSHTSYNEVDNEYIGLISCQYNISDIENNLKKKSCRKVCGLILSPSDNTKLEYISFNRNHISVIYIPENITDYSYDWMQNLKLKFCISNNGTNFGDDIIIPDSFREIPAHMFENCTSIKNISLPDSITSINEFAFSGCNNLTSINLPPQIKIIGERAFNKCSGLSSVSLPQGLQIIGNWAFNECTNLKSIDIPTKIKQISEYAFNKCSNLSSISLPQGLQIIGDNAFSKCSKLVSINIPPKTKIIGSRAFNECSSLSFINLPQRLKSIGSWAFSECKKLTQINIPEGIKEISRCMLSHCSSITSINLPQSVTRICNGAFLGCSSLISVNLPESIHWFEDEAFRNCSSLVSISIPENVISIDRAMFKNCTNLISVNLPESIHWIEDEAFYNCSSLSSISIPEGVTKIGKKAFYGCANLSSINLPESVTDIEDEAFRCCKNITSINISMDIETIGKNAFQGTSLSSVSVPITAKIEPDAFSKKVKVLRENKNILNNIVIPCETIEIECYEFSERTDIYSVYIPNGVTSIGDRAFENCINLSSINIPESVTYIGDEAFSGCINLTSIEIPSSVVSIGDAAFSDCLNLTFVKNNAKATEIKKRTFSGCVNLVSLDIPDCVTSVCNEAFYHCSKLASVNLPENITSIGERAFSNCSSLVSINIPESVSSIKSGTFWGCSSLISINIPNSVTIIEEFAFRECTNLTSITLPDGIRTIKYSAFQNCSGLTSITIPGSVFTIGSYAFAYCHSLTTIKFNKNPFNFPITLDDRSFVNCNSITEFVIPNNATINLGVFEDCSNLTSITLPERMEVIDAKMFRGCKHLKSISIPMSVRFIEDDAFVDCTALSSIRISHIFEDDIIRIFGNIEPNIITFI